MPEMPPPIHIKLRKKGDNMLRINDIKLPLDYSEDDLKKIICQRLHIEEDDLKSFSVFKKSIDARKKDNIVFNISVDVETSIFENFVQRRCRSDKKIQIVDKYCYKLPSSKKLSKRPVVVGAGPAGLFCALILAQAGQCPILIERGKSVDERTKDVEKFWTDGKLLTQSNVQFGEGGAGAFSDGKLNTGTKDSRSRKVLLEFVKHGAPEEILYNAKPHIGTDRLKPTVKNIRNEIIKLGGEVRFETKLIGINTSDNAVQSVTVEYSDGRKDELETNHAVLAIGHSARDTFEMLYKNGYVMKAKPFSVGVRIEHLQENINKSQYGAFYNSPYLGAADYKLNVHLNSGRGVYTFCMCPGGSVVAAASEENTVVTNGMSEFSRSLVNANSALLVGVTPNDFGSDSPLAGVEFQRKIEHAAFVAGGSDYKAPVQRVGDFLKGVKTIGIGEVEPSYRPGYRFANVEEYLPYYVCESLREAIPLLERKLKGFSAADAILTGAETRSSSPLWILRGETMESVSVKGVYPCGEGAGYAGGIISAAVDGIKCAEFILDSSKKTYEKYDEDEFYHEDFEDDIISELLNKQ